MVAIPVSVTFAFPVIVKDPKLGVITLPEGKAVLPISTDAVPIDMSSSGSLAATIVSCESPEIEKVPIEEVEDTPLTNIEVPGVVIAEVRPIPVGVMFTSAVATDVPTEDVKTLPVNAYSDSNIFQRLSLQPISVPVL